MPLCLSKAPIVAVLVRESRNHSSPARRIVTGRLRVQLSDTKRQTHNAIRVNRVALPNAASRRFMSLWVHQFGRPAFGSGSRIYFLRELPENHRNFTGTSPELMFEWVIDPS